MWEAAIGFKYEKGYGMQDCVYSGDSWEDAYDALYDAFHSTTGEYMDDIYNIEQDKPCEIIDKYLPEGSPAAAIGVVYAITKSYE